MCQRPGKNSVHGVHEGNCLVANVDAGSLMRTEPGFLGDTSWERCRAGEFLSSGFPNSAVGVSR